MPFLSERMHANVANERSGIGVNSHMLSQIPRCGCSVVAYSTVMELHFLQMQVHMEF